MDQNEYFITLWPLGLGLAQFSPHCTPLAAGESCGLWDPTAVLLPDTVERHAAVAEDPTSDDRLGRRERVRVLWAGGHGGQGQTAGLGGRGVVRHCAHASQSASPLRHDMLGQNKSCYCWPGPVSSATPLEEQRAVGLPLGPTWQWFAEVGRWQSSSVGRGGCTGRRRRRDSRRNEE